MDIESCAAYTSLKSEKAIEPVRNTRMGELCISARGGRRGGSETGIVTSGSVDWRGSEFVTFVQPKGGITNCHLDLQAVTDGDELLYMPAAGTIQAINATHTGPVKRAIVICASDRENVIKMLELDLDNQATRQYKGGVKDLPGIAAILKANYIRFVVMEFPARCSYAIPLGCAHAFLSLGVVESSVWHPALKLGQYRKVSQPS